MAQLALHRDALAVGSNLTQEVGCGAASGPAAAGEKLEKHALEGLPGLTGGLPWRHPRFSL
jgi:hypothetical protein